MATRTDEFRRQHQEILILARDLAARCRQPRTPESSLQLRRALSELAGNLRVHLAMEDGHLYPQAIQSGNAQLAALARRYYDEMGGAREAFERYVKRWHSTRAIEMDYALFCSETAQIVEAVQRRIVRENAELYPLFDAVEDEPHPRSITGSFSSLG